MRSSVTRLSGFEFWVSVTWLSRGRTATLPPCHPPRATCPLPLAPCCPPPVAYCLPLPSPSTSSAHEMNEVATSPRRVANEMNDEDIDDDNIRTD